MPTYFRRTAGFAVTALVLLAGAASAQGKGKGKDKDHDKDRDKGKGESKALRNDDNDHRDGRIDRNGNVVIRQRDDDRGRDHGRRVPPGLAKKPGQMPPGQYKKRYGTSEGVSVLSDVFGRHGYTIVRTEDAGSNRYVYYRLRDGSVQRAIVSPGTDQLAFSNVPAALLREVLARLY